MSNTPCLASAQALIRLILLLLFSQLTTVTSSLDCCHGKSTSIVCGAGINKVPEPALGDAPFSAPGYCGYSSTNHYQVNPSLDKISFLNLGGADFTILSKEVFRDFPRLVHINLTGNQFEVLVEYAFCLPNKTSELQELNLKNNVIKKILPGAFEGLGNLEKLYLEGNSLTSSSIPDDVFDPLQNLKELRIGSNKLESINRRWFEKLSKLEILSLNSNIIKTLPQFPPSLNNIEEINLKGNQLSVIGDETFSEMISLKKLVMSNNRIQSISERAFEGSYGLQYIDIADNKLEAIPRSVFSCLRDLRVLVISGNQLTTAYPEWFASILNNCDKFSPTDRGEDPEPESVVGGNPWRCDEDMDELAILFGTCIDYALEVKRCAKRIKFPCTGEEKGKSLQDVRNNDTIAKEKYKGMNITGDNRCSYFVPTCNPPRFSSHVSPSQFKLGFAVVGGVILIVTLILSLKYYKGRKRGKSKSRHQDDLDSMESGIDPEEPPPRPITQGESSSCLLPNMSDSNRLVRNGSITHPKPLRGVIDTHINRYQLLPSSSRGNLWKSSSEGSLSSCGMGSSESDEGNSVTPPKLLINVDETRPKLRYVAPSGVPMNPYEQNIQTADVADQSRQAPLRNGTEHRYEMTLGPNNLAEGEISGYMNVHLGQYSGQPGYTQMQPLARSDVNKGRGNRNNVRGNQRRRSHSAPNNPHNHPPIPANSPHAPVGRPRQQCFTQFEPGAQFIPSVVYRDVLETRRPDAHQGNVVYQFNFTGEEGVKQFLENFPKKEKRKLFGYFNRW